MNCERIRVIIDEAGITEVLPYEAGRHVDDCSACRSFSEERLRLLTLLGSAGRVAAPVNFDVLLRARLAQRKNRTAFSWQSPAMYLRFAGVAAVLLVGVLVAQQMSVRRSQPKNSELAQAAPQNIQVSSSPGSGPGGSDAAPVNPSSFTGTVAVIAPFKKALTEGGRRVTTPSRTAGASLTAGGSDFRATAVGLVLLRGPAAEREMAVPIVSLGSQSILYSNDDAKTIRNSRASF